MYVISLSDQKAETNFVLPKKYVIWNSSYVSEDNPMKITMSPEIQGTKDGYRIVHLESLQKYVTVLTMHVLMCPKVKAHCHDPIQLLGEVNRQGLASFIAAKCNGCGETVTLDSPRLPGNNKYEINVRAVSSQMVTGGGAAHLNEQSATLGMPGMTSAAFSTIEDEIGSWWKQVHSMQI